ncbi:hypothetical protein ACWDFR_42255 [Streptomyces sp. 900105755]
MPARPAAEPVARHARLAVLAVGVGLHLWRRNGLLSSSVGGAVGSVALAG